MSRPRLTKLTDIDGSACLPGYVPAEHGIGIVHLGVGAFHRAHQAIMTDDALSKHGGNWRIVGVSLRSKDTANNLNAQNGLYTLIERDASAISARVVAAIDHVIAADAEKTLQVLCDKAIRVVTLTVTEAGYGIDRETRLPDQSNASVAADLENPLEPKSVLGLLVAAIAQRRKQGCKPFTVLSCDNLPNNGSLLRDGVIGFARSSYSDELADWVNNNVAFPSSMVDRITPSPTDETRTAATQLTGCIDNAAVETEPFSQWVIEDRFPSGRPTWEDGGALFVTDVAAYEHMKLTMLNGSHSMLAYAGFLTGQRFVRNVMQDADLALLVHRHFNAAANLLQPLPGICFKQYASALNDRFSNKAIAHETFQIATDGSQKLPQRIFEPAAQAVEAKQSLRPFAFATAMWMRFCLKVSDDGDSYELRDHRSEEINTAINNSTRDASALSEAFHALPNLIPDHLASNHYWRQDISDVLSTALDNGCVAAIKREAALIGAMGTLSMTS